jgi:nucleotide-binding universal stress UspA family protein
LDFYSPGAEPAIIPIPTLRKIIVPLDGSAFGEHAIPLALRIAKLSGASVELVHIHRGIETSAYGRRELYDEFNLIMKRPRQKYITDVVRRIARVSSIPVTPVLVDGRSIAESLRGMVTTGADLVVMATRRRGALRRFVMGSVADMLIRQTSVPLLLVRGYKSPVDFTGAPSFQHILAPLDGTPGSEQILESVATLGQLGESEQTLLRVLPFLPFPESSPTVRNCISVSEHSTDRQRRMLHDLKLVAGRLGRRLPRVHTGVVWSDNSPAEEILLQAEDRQVDLVAVATRKRSRLQRLLRRGIADLLIQKAKVPVLIVSQQDESGRSMNVAPHESLEDTRDWGKA